MNDYLWDKSGHPDPAVERLENLLAPLGHRGSPLHIEPGAPWRQSRWLAAAAAVVLVTGGVWLYRNYARPSWEISGIEGRSRLRVGEWIETKSKALIRAGEIGQVEIEPGTRLGLKASRPQEHRLGVERGTIRATIWAPPRWFYVDTPSAVAVDLGCQYSLEVDESGAGLVYVTAGWVAFEWKGWESLIPAGAACRTRPGAGPGSPYYIDASEPFRMAVEKLDAEGVRGTPLKTALEEARKRDAFTLWHLLARADPSERGVIYDRLAELVAPPAGVTREGIVAGDTKMFELWWNAFGLGDKSWWGVWKFKPR